MDDDLLRFLAEDVGAGDITTRALAGDTRVRAVILAKQPCVVAGLAEASMVFAHLGAKAQHLAGDGQRVAPRTEVLRLDGPASAILTGERLALNLLMRLSGIATTTADLQAKVAAVDPRSRITATRKTTPGFRKFEKRAVELGGGDPNRFGLFDAFLVKDNHLLVEPDVAAAIQKCRAQAPGRFLQVEADTAEQARAAAAAGADGVLLDNFAPDQARALYRELKAARPTLVVEVSGGITPANVADYAGAGDRISMGWITHSAPAIDFGLDVLDVR